MIHDNLKIFRKSIGISQRELGRRIEMSGQYIAKIEKGERTPTIETLKKIASALGVELLELLERPKFTSEIFLDKISEKNLVCNTMLTDCKLDNRDLKSALYNDPNYSINGSTYSLDDYYTIGLYLGFSKDFLEKRRNIDADIRDALTPDELYEYTQKISVSYDLWANNYYQESNLNELSFEEPDFPEVNYMLEKYSEPICSEYSESDTFSLCDIDKYLHSTLINILSFATNSNALNYGLNDFSHEEIDELSNFIFISYKLKVNEILERHKTSNNIE